MRPPPFPIRADLAQRKARQRGKRLRAVLTAVFGVLFGLSLVVLWIWRWAFADLPAVPSAAALWSLNRTPAITFLDRDGGQIGVRGSNRSARLKIGDLPAYVPRAFIAAEDRRFYSHFGVDPVGLARATWVNIQARRVVEGGSTITQQLARNLFLTPDQTLRRKAQEAALAVIIEQRAPKSEILALYLDRIYFGAGAYGIEAAAQTYFGKPAKALTLPEAALLASLPKAPTRFARSNLTGAMARSHEVLRDMRQEGWITADTERQAKAAPPGLAPPSVAEDDYGYLLDLASARVSELTRGGAGTDLVVRLTVDPRLQAEAAAAVRDGVARGRAQGGTQASLVALGPGGAVRAYVGGVDHRDSPYDRAGEAMRQPGSAFKPFVYAAALEAGVSPADVRNDAPVSFGEWSPKNAGGGYAGPVTLSDALARSINTISARLTSEVGAAKVAQLAQRFGIRGLPPTPALSISLGAYETTLFELTSAYQVLQQGGRRSEPHFIEEIATPEGQVLYRYGEIVTRTVYDARLNGQMVRMMEGVITKGTGRNAALDRPAAGKTGTSQNGRDAWFVGFTPDWVAGVWMGDDRDRPMKDIGGGDIPAEVWKRFMLAAHQGLPARDFSMTSANRTEEARAAFYETLASDLERGAPGAAPTEPVPATSPAGTGT